MTDSRTRIDIMSQILETANGGVSTKLKLMYKANLSYAQLKGYLITLTDKGLLSYDLNTNTLKTTEKGLRFLEIYNKLIDLIRTTTTATNLSIEIKRMDRRSDREKER